MKEYQQKHKVEKLLYSKVVVVILFVLVLFLFRSVMELNDKRLEVDTLRDETRVEKSNLEQKVGQKEERNEFIKTSRGLEGYIRETLPVVKEDEGVIVIYDNDKSPVSEVRDSMNIWERLIVLWNKI